MHSVILQFSRIAIDYLSAFIAIVLPCINTHFSCYSQPINLHPTSINEYFENVESVTPPFRSEVGTYIVCFQSFASAFKALRKEEHTIRGCTIRLYHEWYFAEMKERATVDNTLQQMDERLNDDCILSIMKSLDFEDLLYVALYNDRFRALAKKKPLKSLHLQFHDRLEY